MESQLLGHQGSPTTPLLSFRVCLGVHAPEESDRALCLESGRGWSPGRSLEPHFSWPRGVTTGNRSCTNGLGCCQLSAQTHSSQPSVGGCCLRTPPLVYTLHSALFPQPSPGARESWPGQGPAPSLASLWSRCFLFLGLAGALSSSASRNPWAGDSWAPRVQIVASTGDPEVSASSSYLFLSLSQSIIVIILFLKMYIY